jgi:hypothetical protein
MNKYDLLIILYPDITNLESVMIVDPFDKKVLYFEVNSIDEVKEVLRSNLPFCDQGHEAQIHFGSARVIEWSNLSSSDISIKTSEDIDEVLS